MSVLWRAAKQGTVGDARVQLEDDDRGYRTIETILSHCEEKARPISGRVPGMPSRARGARLREGQAQVMTE